MTETRSSRWRAFPAPLLAVILFGTLAYAAGATVVHALPGIPWVTPAVSVLEDFWSLHLLVLWIFELLLVASGLWLLYRFVGWWFTVFAVTDHRVLIQRGFLTRAVDEIPVDQIRGVDVHQSIVGRILGYGTVKVSSEGGRGIGNEDWHGVPRPFEFQRTIETMVQDSSIQHVIRGAPGFTQAWGVASSKDATLHPAP